jgi:predicted nucleotide-binding protein (sugar kinase/HSP70/actin superfamily)
MLKNALDDKKLSKEEQADIIAALDKAKETKNEALEKALKESLEARK